MEFLIRIRDRGGVDPPKGFGDSKAGDVIAACPDSWAWTVAELTSPDWRIVRAPLTQVEVDGLLAPGAGDPATGPVYKRKMRVNFSLSSLPAAIRNWARDDSRSTPIFDATSQVTKLRAAVELKA